MFSVVLGDPCERGDDPLLVPALYSFATFLCQILLGHFLQIRCLLCSCGFRKQSQTTWKEPYRIHQWVLSMIEPWLNVFLSICFLFLCILHPFAGPLFATLLCRYHVLSLIIGLLMSSMWLPFIPSAPLWGGSLGSQ